MAPNRTDRSRPNKIAKTAQYALQCRLVAAGLDAGEPMDAIAAQIGRSARQVYRIKLDFQDFGYPTVKATVLLEQLLGVGDHSQSNLLSLKSAGCGANDAEHP
jgi:hypothetical protein